MSPPSRYYSMYLLFHVIISISHPHSLLYAIQSGIWPYQTTGNTFPDVTNNTFSSLTFLWQFIAYHTFLYTSLLLWIFIIHVWSFSHVNICHFFFLDSSFPISTFFQMLLKLPKILQAIFFVASLMYQLLVHETITFLINCLSNSLLEFKLRKSRGMLLVPSVWLLNWGTKYASLLWCHQKERKSSKHFW